MTIEGLSCPGCGGHVIDNGEACNHCHHVFGPDIKAIQKRHHDVKMEHLADIQRGTITIPEAT